MTGDSDGKADRAAVGRKKRLKIAEGDRVRSLGEVWTVLRAYPVMKGGVVVVDLVDLQNDARIVVRAETDVEAVLSDQPVQGSLL